MSREFARGVMAALGVVYMADDETLAEEIVKTADYEELLKVARSAQDPYLPNLQNTVRFLKTRGDIV